MRVIYAKVANSKAVAPALVISISLDVDTDPAPINNETTLTLSVIHHTGRHTTVIGVQNLFLFRIVHVFGIYKTYRHLETSHRR